MSSGFDAGNWIIGGRKAIFVSKIDYKNAYILYIYIYIYIHTHTNTRCIFLL
jgi:hypothetical protein